MIPLPFFSLYIDRVLGFIMLGVFVWAMLAVAKGYGAEIAEDFRTWWNRRRK